MAKAVSCNPLFHVLVTMARSGNNDPVFFLLTEATERSVCGKYTKPLLQSQIIADVYACSGCVCLSASLVPTPTLSVFDGLSFLFQRFVLGYLHSLMISHFLFGSTYGLCCV